MILLFSAAALVVLMLLAALFALHRDVDRLYDVLEGLCHAQVDQDQKSAALKADVAALRARVNRMGRTSADDISPSIMD